MKTISAPQLHELLTAQPDLTLLDVRTPVEFAEVHVAHARNLPLDALAPSQLVDSGLAKDQPVYLLCRSGTRASKAAERLAQAGFNHPVVIEGGTLAWLKAGLPATRGQTRVISLERQVRIVAGALVLTGVVLGWLVHGGFFGVSAFVGAGLLFAGITDYCGMGLLLARAPWNKRLAS